MEGKPQGSRSIRDFVYNSQIKEKFTIKSLLGDGLERNYVSQQSQRTKLDLPRSQTMYGQKMRVLLIKQNKRERMQSEMKKKRQQSTYQIVRSNSGTEVKQVKNEDKIKLKRILGNQDEFDNEESIHTIFEFVSCLAQVNNHYQEAFQFMNTKLRNQMFIHMQTQIGNDLRNLANKSNNQILMKMVFRDFGKTTFKKVCKQLLTETSQSLAKCNRATQNQLNSQENSNSIIQQKQQIISKLKRQLKYYQQHPSQDLYPYVKKLQKENKEMKDEIYGLVHLKNQNEYSIQIHEATNLLLRQQIEKLKNTINELEVQQLAGLNQVQNNSEMKVFEQNVGMLRQMLDKSKLKMLGLKEEFDKLKQQNQELINERSVLAKRAAVGFGELTPRPNMRKIFTDHGLVYENFISLKKKMNSTENIVLSLVKKFKNSNMENLGSSSGHKEVELNESQNENVSKEEEMNEVINYIDDVKSQIDKTLQATQLVKKGVSNQNKIINDNKTKKK